MDQIAQGWRWSKTCLCSPNQKAKREFPLVSSLPTASSLISPAQIVIHLNTPDVRLSHLLRPKNDVLLV